MMERIVVASVFEAFDYVMDHVFPYGGDGRPARTDEYAIICVQDTQNDGFGIAFQENAYCKGALTVLFDDVEGPLHGYRPMGESQALEILRFIEDYRDVETLLVCCYGGQSRSQAIGVFAAQMAGAPRLCPSNGRENAHVLKMLQHIYSHGESQETN